MGGGTNTSGNNPFRMLGPDLASALPKFLQGAPERAQNLMPKIFGHPDYTNIDPFSATANTPGAQFFATPGITGSRLAQFAQNNPGIRGQGFHLPHLVDQLNSQGGIWLGQRPEGGTVFSTEQDPRVQHISAANDAMQRIQQQNAGTPGTPGSHRNWYQLLAEMELTNPSMANLMRTQQQSGSLNKPGGGLWQNFYKANPV